MADNVEEAEVLNAALGDTVKQAAQIKSAQQQQLSRQFQSWPPYFQRTMFVPPEIHEVRKLAIKARMTGALQVKDEGNELFKKGDYPAALAKYELGLGVFRFIINKNPNWRKEGIKDEDIIPIDTKGETVAEDEELKKYKLSCYLNISATLLKLEDYINAIRAANDALSLDSKNPKAYYRRAQALVSIPSGGDVEFQQAISDLNSALEINPNDPTVRKELARVKQLHQSQKDKQKKTFGGMFDRGQVVNDSDKAKETNSQSTEQAASKQVEDAENLAAALKARGEEDEAEKVLKIVAEFQKKVKGPPEDHSKITKEIVDDAMKHGLNMSDPRVLAYWIKLNRVEQSKQGGQELSLQDEANDFSLEDLEKALEQLTDEGLEAFCRDQKIPLMDCDTSDKLRARVLAALSPPTFAPTKKSMLSSYSSGDMLFLAIVIAIASLIIAMIYNT